VLLLRRTGSYVERPWLRFLLILLIGSAVRLPALQGQWIWDDHYLAHDNPFIKSPLLVFEAFRHFLFLDSSSAHYRPLQNISYIVDYLFWNTDTTGFHLSNILWHTGSGILLWRLLERLLPQLASRWLLQCEEQTAIKRRSLSLLSFLLALLWVVHPVHSAAVDYISGRADSLAFFFAAGGWLLFLQAGDIARPLVRRMMYALAAMSGLFALCSRESAGLWIAIFILYLFAFDKERSLRVKLFIVAACIGVTAGYCGLRHLPPTRTSAHAESAWSPPMRAVLMLRALGDYTRVMMFPSNLHMERSVFEPRSYLSNESWRESAGVEYLSVLGAGTLACLVFGACRRGTGQSLRVCGASWFLLTFLPTSNLFDLNATVAEHWLYLPSVGFAIFLCGVAFDLPLRWRRSATALACVAVVAFSVRSAIRSSDWVNPETFFRRTLAAGGGSGRAAVNLALIYSTRGDYPKAEAILRRVLQCTPDYPIARNNLADVLARSGKKSEAEQILTADITAARKTRKEEPRTWLAAVNKAHVRAKDHDMAGALTLLVAARQDYPGTWELISFEAELLRRSKRAGEALALIQDFARQNWWHHGAALALGRLYAELNDAEHSEAALRQASRLDVHDAEALDLLAQIKVRQNRLNEAFTTQSRAVSRQPDEPRQYLLLSDILEKMGRGDEARATLAIVDRLQSIAHSQTVAN
jgi:Flp pilus assembly protein TadD